MAVSKSAEKERLKKERVSKLGKELLDKEMKKTSLQERITAATLPEKDGEKWYKSWDAGKPRVQIAKEIIQADNRRTKGIPQTATERMKKDTTSMGYKTVEKSRAEKPLFSISSPDLDPGNEARLKKYYGDVEGQKRIDEENKIRRKSNFDTKYKNVLKNKWEDESYGAEKKKKNK